jgi:TonB family protein
MARRLLSSVGQGLGLAVLLVAVAAGGARAQAPQPQVDPTPVYTICTLLVGAPPPSSQPRSMMFTLSASKLSALEAAQYAENVVELQEKLKTAFNLGQLDVVSSYGEWMSPGREMVLEGPGGGPKLVIGAQGVTEQPTGEPVRKPDGSITFVSRPGKKSANYSLHLTSGGNVVFDKPLSVALGARSVMARQAEANGPLYFVVIAVPTPGAPMQTILGLEVQDATTGVSSVVRGVAGGVGGGAAGGVGGGVGGGVSGRGVGAGVAGGVRGGVAGGVEAGISSGGTGGVVGGAVGGSGRQIRAPKLIYSLQPTLSAEARAAGLKGPVILMATIGEDGSVRDIKVFKGVDGLNDIAIAAFRQWRFEPPSLDENGKPLKMQLTVAFPFRDEPQ